MQSRHMDSVQETANTVRRITAIVMGDGITDTDITTAVNSAAMAGAVADAHSRIDKMDFPCVSEANVR